MNAKQVLQKVKQHPGAFMRLVVASEVQTLKDFQDSIVTKRSELFVTAGVEFQNRKDVSEAIAAGERGEVGPLPWGEWIEYPFIIGHTRKDGTYNEYVRFYPPSEAQLRHFNLTPRVQFFVDGQPVNRETAILYCGSKVKPEEQKSEAFAINVENIESLS